MAVAYCLRKTFGWGKIKIYRYAVDMNRYITSVGKQDRDIPALNDELRTEAGMTVPKILRVISHICSKRISLPKNRQKAEAMFAKKLSIYYLWLYIRCIQERGGNKNE